jgi:hypothetical protein
MGLSCGRLLNQSTHSKAASSVVAVAAQPASCDSRLVSTPSIHGGGYLPTDALERAGRRLSIAAFVVSGGFAFMSVLYLTVFAHSADLLSQLLSAATIVVSVTVGWYVRTKRCTPLRAMHVGLAYEILVCFGIWLGDFRMVAPAGVPAQISWACAIILFFPALVPTTPRITLATSIAAVASGLPAYWLAQQLRESPITDPAVLVSLWLSALMCALLAYVPARVVHRLGRDVKEARQLGSYQLVDQLGEGGVGEVGSPPIFRRRRSPSAMIGGYFFGRARHGAALPSILGSYFTAPPQ